MPLWVPSTLILSPMRHVWQGSQESCIAREERRWRGLEKEGKSREKDFFLQESECMNPTLQGSNPLTVSSCILISRLTASANATGSERQ